MNFFLKKMAFLVVIAAIVYSPIYANEVIISIPKSGTNLAIKAIKLITRKTIHNNINYIDQYDTSVDEMIFWAHYWKTPNELERSLGPTIDKLETCRKYNLKILIIVRDPRELVCALCRATGTKDIQHVIRNPGIFLNAVTGKNDFLEYQTLSQAYEKILEWGGESNTYITTYEKLVGNNGMGSKEIQIQEILNIAKFLGKEFSYERAEYISSQLYGDTPTFINGQINSWKKLFTREDIELFDSLESDLLDKYSKN